MKDIRTMNATEYIAYLAFKEDFEEKDKEIASLKTELESMQKVEPVWDVEQGWLQSDCKVSCPIVNGEKTPPGCLPLAVAYVLHSQKLCPDFEAEYFDGFDNISDYVYKIALIMKAKFTPGGTPTEIDSLHNFKDHGIETKIVYRNKGFYKDDDVSFIITICSRLKTQPVVVIYESKLGCHAGFFDRWDVEKNIWRLNECWGRYRWVDCDDFVEKIYSIAYFTSLH